MKRFFLLILFIYSKVWGISFKDYCLQNEQVVKKQLKISLNELIDPRSQNLATLLWTPYCDCYAGTLDSQPKSAGNMTQAAFKAQQDALNLKLQSCVEKVGFSGSFLPAPSKINLAADPFFDEKIKACSQNPVGQTILIEVLMGSLKDPRKEKVRTLSLSQYCQCYVSELRRKMGDSDARLAVQSDLHKIQDVTKMMRLNQDQDSAIEFCVADQIPYPDKTNSRVQPSALNLSFEQIYASEFVVGKGLGPLQIGISVEKVFEIMGKTAVKTTRTDFDEYRFGPNLTELKLRTSPPGPNGKLVYVSVNYQFRGPISQGIKRGELFESVIEKMKPKVPHSKDRHIGFLMYKEGAQFQFADYNKGTLEGLIAFEPSTHPLLKTETAKRKDWFACQSDSDCVVVGHACGEPQAVHRKYQSDFNQALGPSPHSCAQPPPSQLYRGSCLGSLCKVKDLKN